MTNTVKYDIVVAGAGPAGLTASIYAARSGKSVCVIERTFYGGQIINAGEIENFPAIKCISGFEFSTQLYEQAKGFGVHFLNCAVVEVQRHKQDIMIKTDSEIVFAKSLIIATGTQKRPLGVDREEELVGKGVSYCGICDGAFYRGKDVAVVGGGNTAVDDAINLSSYCHKVYIIHRRSSFKAESIKIQRLKDIDNIEAIMNSSVTEIIGKNKVEGIALNKNGKKSFMRIDALFINVGQTPNNAIFSSLVRLDGNGYIVTDENCNTGTSGIFAAGDCRAKSVRQLTTAVSDGTIAALQAVSYINEKPINAVAKAPSLVKRYFK